MDCVLYCRQLLICHNLKSLLSKSENLCQLEISNKELTIVYLFLILFCSWIVLLLLRVNFCGFKITFVNKMLIRNKNKMKTKIYYQ